MAEPFSFPSAGEPRVEVYRHETDAKKFVACLFADGSSTSLVDLVGERDGQLKQTKPIQRHRRVCSIEHRLDQSQ